MVQTPLIHKHPTQKTLGKLKKLDVCLFVFFFHLTFISGEQSEKQLQNFNL